MLLGSYKCFAALPLQIYWCSAPKSEQTAIAQILTDMDNEIAQLEKERDKYKELKAGMMQVLLTGKIRLILKI